MVHIHILYTYNVCIYICMCTYIIHNLMKLCFFIVVCVLGLVTL